MKQAILLLCVFSASFAKAIIVDAPRNEACTLAAEKAVTILMKKEKAKGFIKATEIENRDYTRDVGPYYISWSLDESNGDCFLYLKVKTQKSARGCSVISIEDISDSVDTCS